jgi:hypothetical protein
MLAAVTIPLWALIAIIDALLILYFVVSDTRARRRRRRRRDRIRALRSLTSEASPEGARR